MSRYYVNKFLYQVDGDPELLAAYKADPAALLERWEAEYGRRLGTKHTIEQTTWLGFTEQERTALIAHDYVTLFEIGAHFFLCLTIYIAIYDEDYMAHSGPLAFQREYAAKLSHWLGKDYPTVAL
jgi:hypothetical protein